ncbi:hypothetical protein Tco_0751813 [Tanacetum coccineum]|uniref:Uncharacterized protein n=1 Tax=Tanacetum coccineum TaxID=301880 RepID=A0ABQ4Z8B3_9ASTR
MSSIRLELNLQTERNPEKKLDRALRIRVVCVVVKGDGGNCGGDGFGDDGGVNADKHSATSFEDDGASIYMLRYISSKALRIRVVCVVVKGDGDNCGGDGFGDDGGVNGSYHQRRFPVMQGGDEERLRWFLYVLLRNTSEVGWDVNRSEY